MKIDPLAGKPPPAAMLVHVPRLVAACYTAAEITARAERDPGETYSDLTQEFGAPAAARVEAPAPAAQRR